MASREPKPSLTEDVRVVPANQATAEDLQLIFAQERGAAALEAYPIVSGASWPEELHVGSLAAFCTAGMTEVHRPTPRRAVVRVDFR